MMEHKAGMNINKIGKSKENKKWTALLHQRQNKQVHSYTHRLIYILNT